MLAGLYFSYTDHWSYYGHHTIAQTIWAECYDRRLIGATVYRMGALYATLSGTPRLPFTLRRILRRLLRTVFKLTWHPRLFVETSKTICCVPIEADKIPAVKLRLPSPIEGDRIVAEDRVIEDLSAQSHPNSEQSAENPVTLGLKANLR